jgi:hypothetical protein
MRPSKRTLVPLAFAANIALFWLGSMASVSCDIDEPPPKYVVQDTFLRLIPEQQSVDGQPGTFFVLVELTRAESSKDPVVIFLQADDAVLHGLPGPGFCSKPAASDSGASDAAGEAGSGGGQAQTATLAIPYAGLLQDSARKVRETGVLLQLPEGKDDVLLTATAYSYAGSAAECAPKDPQLAAIASVRISRTSPEAGPVDAGAEDGDAAPTPEAGNEAGNGAPEDASDSAPEDAGTDGAPQDAQGD